MAIDDKQVLENTNTLLRLKYIILQIDNIYVIVYNITCGIMVKDDEIF